MNDTNEVRELNKDFEAGETEFKALGRTGLVLICMAIAFATGILGLAWQAVVSMI